MTSRSPVDFYYFFFFTFHSLPWCFFLQAAAFKPFNRRTGSILEFCMNMENTSSPASILQNIILFLLLFAGGGVLKSGTFFGGFGDRIPAVVGGK